METGNWLNVHIQRPIVYQCDAMRPEQIYQELKDLAEKLDITVSEQNFRITGLPVKSGFCVIKGKMHCIIDKNINLHKKISVLAETLAGFPHENLYLVPAVRDLLNRYARKGAAPTAASGSDV